MPPSDFAEDRRRVEDLVEERRLEEAAAALEPICEHASATARDWLILGQLRLELNQAAAALAALERADGESPGQASIINALAHALFSLGRAEDAYARLQGQLARTPGDPELHFNLGFIGERLQKRDEACAHYSAALNLDAGHYRARLNRAALLSDLGTLDDALADYEVLVEAYPEDAAAWFSRAECLVKCRRFIDAAAAADRALAIDPSYVKAILCKAVALASCGEVRPAQDLFNTAWAQDRDAASRYGHADDPMSSVPDARAIHVYQELQCLYRADWSGYAAFAASFEKYIASEEGPPSDLSMALPAMYAPLPAPSRAKVHVAITRTIASAAGTPMAPVLPSGRQRLRVAYLSSKFRANPSFVLVSGLLEAHDRGRFEIVGYALNPDDGSVERVQSADAVDVFVDLSQMNDEEAARRIRSDGIDILIDLNGYSDEARPGILARRPAPLQVNYLGHMHSLYAPWIDYRFTDAVAEPVAAGYAPPEARVFSRPVTTFTTNVAGLRPRLRSAAHWGCRRMLSCSVLSAASRRLNPWFSQPGWRYSSVCRTRSSGCWIRVNRQRPIFALQPRAPGSHHRGFVSSGVSSMTNTSTVNRQPIYSSTLSLTAPTRMALRHCMLASPW